MGEEGSVRPMRAGLLFHHHTSTCIENVKFREVNVDLLPGTSSGK